MRNKVLVGITQRVDFIESHNERRDALDQRLIDWLVGVGCIPIPIPNTLIDISLSTDVNSQPVLADWLRALNVQAFILSGGNDIGTIIERDMTESFLLSWAKEFFYPVVGVCRGMQMMAVWAGGNLKNVDGHVKSRHYLQYVDSSFKRADSVNSYHNLALEECPDQFRIKAISEDGSIEAIEHIELPWEAWMWHPEREVVFSKHEIDRLRRLLKNE